MRTCLINAGTGTEFIDGTEFGLESLRRETNEPQLGILSLAAVLEAHSCAPALVDLNRSFYAYADQVGEVGIHSFAQAAAREIVTTKAEIFGFGSICSTYPLTIRIAEAVKALRPESLIVFGGPQASVVSTQTLEAFPFVDFVLRGEAEQSLPLLLEEVNGKLNFGRVPGLTHRTPFGVQQNPDAPLLLDLDVLPSPAYHLTGELRGAQRASLELGRGCPFACTFCSTNDFFRRKFRLRSPQRVLQDMRAIEEQYGIRDFDLVHDMFTVDAKRVRAFCHELMDSGKGYTWSCSARTDCVSEELIELMAAAGCKGMFFGVETGSARLQRIIDKHLDTGRAHQIIDIAERAHIRSTVSLITGFPQENQDDLRDTLEMFMHSARSPLSSPQLNLLAPLANTPLHREYKHEMILDLLCSDMSHQGRRQHEEDIKLIRKYPDIFPNFYLLPTNALDRGMLIELREFTLAAEARFRWLFGAVHQASGDILAISTDWMRMREQLHPALLGPELRHYYRTRLFGTDFMEFVRSHDVASSPLITALLEFEEAVDAAPSPETSRLSSHALIERGHQLDWSDIPVRTLNSRVIKLSFDLEKMMDAVKNRQECERHPSSQHYVVPQSNGKGRPIRHVSLRIAKVVSACDGSRTIYDVANSVAQDMEVPSNLVDRIVLQLLEKARAEGLVAIFRISSADSASQGAGFAVAEYDARRDDASLQKQFSTQAI